MKEHKLPSLPYKKTELSPHISEETLDYHYGKHHQTYVTNLNKLLPDSEFSDSSLEEIIENASGAIFNNAAQIWNHSFYWNCLTPNGGGEPNGKLADAIKHDFGSFASFKEKFTQASASLFGSGWAFLAQTEEGSLSIVQESNAGNPLRSKLRPILTCDMWEHAYYIDYRNARPKYLDSFWQLVNWDFASRNLK
jgi:superoxide dismutase, Fe-Mn family